MVAIILCSHFLQQNHAIYICIFIMYILQWELNDNQLLEKTHKWLGYVTKGILNFSPQINNFLLMITHIFESWLIKKDEWNYMCFYNTANMKKNVISFDKVRYIAI